MTLYPAPIPGHTEVGIHSAEEVKMFVMNSRYILGCL